MAVDCISGKVWHGYDCHILSAELDSRSKAFPRSVTCLEPLWGGQEPPVAGYEVKYRSSTDRKDTCRANMSKYELMDRPTPFGKLSLIA